MPFTTPHFPVTHEKFEVCWASEYTHVPHLRNSITLDGPRNKFSFYTDMEIDGRKSPKYYSIRKALKR